MEQGLLLWVQKTFNVKTSRSGHWERQQQEPNNRPMHWKYDGGRFFYWWEKGCTWKNLTVVQSNKNRADLCFRSYDRCYSPTQSFLLTFLYAPRYRVEAPRMYLDVLRSSHDTSTISEWRSSLRGKSCNNTAVWLTWQNGSCETICSGYF